MAKASVIQTNFSSGELSPKLLGRVDVNKYDNGAAQLQNWIVSPHGGAVRTPGTTFVGEVWDPRYRSRLIPFQFNNEQTYILEFGNNPAGQHQGFNGVIRFYTDGGILLLNTVAITTISEASTGVVTLSSSAPAAFISGWRCTLTGLTGNWAVLNNREFEVTRNSATSFDLLSNVGAGIDTSTLGAFSGSSPQMKMIYQVSHPYRSTDSASDYETDFITYAQSGDVMYFASPYHRPQKLTRFGPTTWTFGDVDFGTTIPYMLNQTDVTLTPDVTTGTGTITASRGIFGQIGESSTVDDTWIGVRLKLNSGTVTIDDVTSSTVVAITVVSNLSGTTATAAWEEYAWSGGSSLATYAARLLTSKGFPRSVCFYEQRLVFSSTIRHPQSVFASESADIEDFTTGTNAGDGFTYTVATDEANPILWLHPGNVLLIGTSGGVFSLASSSSGDPLTPTNVAFRRQTSFGASPVRPVAIGDRLYFVQLNEQILREFYFTFDSSELGSYRASDITIISEHLMKGGIWEMAAQEGPISAIWCVLGNGNLAVMTRELDQEVAGWTDQLGAETTDGTSPPASLNADYESIAIIPSAESSNRGVDYTKGDEVWVVAERWIAGAGGGTGAATRYIEYFKPLDYGTDIEDAFFVQSGLTYEGSAASSLTGLYHLRGEVVDVFGNGVVFDQATVGSDGTLTTKLAGVTTTVTKAHIGLAYTSTIKTLRPDAGSAIGSSQGMLKRINNVIVRVRTAMQLKVGDPTTQYAQTMTEAAQDSLDVDADGVATGDVEAHHDGGWSKDSQVVIKCDDPVPCEVLAVIKQLDEEDR